MQAVRVMAENETLGQYLARMREAAGLSSPEKVEEAARLKGFRAKGRTIRQIESDRVNRPEIETLEVLASVYGLDYEDLLRRAGYLAKDALTQGADGLEEDEGQYTELYRALAPRDRELIIEVMRRMRGTGRP